MAHTDIFHLELLQGIIVLLYHNPRNKKSKIGNEIKLYCNRSLHKIIFDLEKFQETG
jgi:hypothetical protein